MASQQSKAPSTLRGRRASSQAFIFQSRFDRFDLSTQLRPNATQRWVASRYRTAMRPGDIVYLWLAGPEDIRGIYGWGTIKSFPKRSRNGNDYGVEIRVDTALSRPLLASTIRRSRELSDLLILRAPQATNFLLSPNEARAIADAIKRIGEAAPDIMPAHAAHTRKLAHVERRTGVFISYSHADAEWLKRLQVHLTPLERSGGFEFWDDTRIRPGDDWRREIAAGLGRSKVAVLLVSADFLASRFVMENELPALLAAASDEGAIVLAVIVSPCRYLETKSISRYQAVNPASQPLSMMNANDREQVFYRVSIAVEAALARIHKAHD